MNTTMTGALFRLPRLPILKVCKPLAPEDATYNVYVHNLHKAVDKPTMIMRGEKKPTKLRICCPISTWKMCYRPSPQRSFASSKLVVACQKRVVHIVLISYCRRDLVLVYRYEHHRGCAKPAQSFQMLLQPHNKPPRLYQPMLPPQWRWSRFHQMVLPNTPSPFFGSVCCAID
jgi:hypothetical protein